MLPKSLRFLHPYLHFFGLVLMVAGLPFSVFLMSLSQFWIGGNWILEGNYKEKILTFLRNKDALFLSGILFLLLPGLTYSEDISEGWKLVRLNLPFLIFPLVLGSRAPLSQNWYNLLIRLFIFSVFLATIVCSVLRIPLWLNGELSDIRQISIFISHIRFSLLICLAILIGLWIIVKKPWKLSNLESALFIIAISWMTIFLFILQSLTGIALLLALITLTFILASWKYLPRKWALATTLLPFIFLISISFLSFSAWKKYITPAPIYRETLESHTSKGGLYTHEFSILENGHYINSFVCRDELKLAWSSRSKINFDSSDSKGHPVAMTLIRYLNSKGLKKDYDAVLTLSNEEIRYIENGVANVNYTGFWGIRTRFYQLLWEIDYYRRDAKSPQGHTLMTKAEFWKHGLLIVSKHPFIGVGTGDVLNAFKQSYATNNSWLSKRWWLTSHNYYLYIAVASGIIGLCIFLICFIYPFIHKKGWNYYPFLVFFSISALSMLTEDTLNTQAGVSFIAFFYSIFLFAKSKETS